VHIQVTFWTLAYILTSDDILQQVKLQVDDAVGVDSKSKLTLSMYYATCVLTIFYVTFHSIYYCLQFNL